MDDNSDRYGTGEHLTAGKDPDIRVNADLDVDRVVGPEEAGLGDGLDQAEEANLKAEGGRRKAEAKTRGK